MARSALLLFLALPLAAQVAPPPRLASRIAFVNPDGSFALPPPQVGSGFNGAVTALLAQPKRKVLVLGEFSAYAGRTGLKGLALLDEDGRVDEAFSRHAGRDLSKQGRYDAAVLQSDGRILLGGFFTTFGPHAANGIVRLMPTGGVDVAFLNKSTKLYIGESAVRVRSIAVAKKGGVLIAGDFVHRPSVLLLNSDGSPAERFRAPLELARFSGTHNDDDIEIALQPDGKILLAGSYLTPSPPGSAARLVRLLADGRMDPSFTPAEFRGHERSIHALRLLPDGRILVGGSFNEVSGSPASNLARLQRDGAPDEGFLRALGEGFGRASSERVRAILHEKSGSALVGGDFGLGKLLPDGRVDDAFSRMQGRGFSGPVHALARLPDGRILAGGAFDTLADPKGAFPSQFRSCSWDSQCRVVPAPCGEWETVARAFAADVEQANARAATTVDCVERDITRREPVCRAGLCQAN